MGSMTLRTSPGAQTTAARRLACAGEATKHCHLGVAPSFGKARNILRTNAVSVGVACDARGTIVSRRMDTVASGLSQQQLVPVTVACNSKAASSSMLSLTGTPHSCPENLPWRCVSLIRPWHKGYMHEWLTASQTILAPGMLCHIPTLDGIFPALSVPLLPAPASCTLLCAATGGW